MNANIGNSALSSSIHDEVEKLTWSTRWGADTVMDLSTGKIFMRHASGLLKFSGSNWNRSNLSSIGKSRWHCGKFILASFEETLIEQAEQGVDYFTIHAGVLLRYVPMTAERVTGIVSRGGSIMAKWCLAHHEENFLYTRFEDICKIMKKYDVTFR